MLLGGCAAERALVQSAVAQPITSVVELTETPFFPQTDDLCGPAALATVLNHSGAAVSLEELRRAVYIPGRGGSLQLELVAAARRHGRVPYRIEPRLEPLVAELRAGRSVLVLQNLGVKIAPLWHFAVVVGYYPEAREVVLRSGPQRRHVVAEAKFLRSWRRAAHWGVVTLRPGELPVIADEERYLRSVAAMESTGQHDAALPAYRAALRRWPASPLALLGLGNAHYAAGNLIEAEAAYRSLLRAQPAHPVALNNLAQTLADRGCTGQARTTIEAALDAAHSSEWLFASLTATREEIPQAPLDACAD